MRALTNGTIVAVFGLALGACTGGGGKGTIPAISDQDMSLGKADAPVQVVEYASAACSHCAEFDRDTFATFKAKYIDTGQVRYAMRELITPPEAYAVAGFLLARCAGKDKYFPVIEAVFRAQQMWADQARANQEPDFRTPLVQVAATAGMSEADFQKCVGDDKAIDALNKRVQENGKNTVDKNGRSQGTPIFYVGGKQRFPSGVPSMENLDKAIADAKAGK